MAPFRDIRVFLNSLWNDARIFSEEVEEYTTCWRTPTSRFELNTLDSSPPDAHTNVFPSHSDLE